MYVIIFVILLLNFPIVSLCVAVQPQLTNQGIVSSHMNYLPGTPSPTFPGLQPSILQSGGEDNFQIDFLHDSDVRGN